MRKSSSGIGQRREDGTDRGRATRPLYVRLSAPDMSTPSAQYSLTLRVQIDHRPGMLGKVASAIGEAGGTIGAVDLVQVQGSHTIRDITVETADSAAWPV